MKKLFFTAISLVYILWSHPTFAQDKLVKAQGFLQQSHNNLSFEENKGQITGQDANRVKFTIKDQNLKVFVLNDGIAYQFEKINYPEGYNPKAMSDPASTPQEQKHQQELMEKIGVETYRMDMQLIGANQHAEIITEQKSTDYINYYNHNTLDVHSYQKVRYKNIYHNIDWVLYIEDGKVEYEFEVHPDGDPNKIQMQLKWVEKSNIDASGNLHLENRMGKITDKAPETFQNGKIVGSAYLLNDKKLSFHVDDYDRNQMLRIDPTLDWATYYGGADYDRGNFCATDASGSVYMAGQTSSLSSIASGGHQIVYGGGFDDAFLVKFNTSGTRQWATYYGGTGSDKGFACVIDGSGNVYLNGNTFSSNNIASGGFQNVYGGFADVFLVKFNTSGIRQWATYYGGALYDNGLSCAIDASDNIYLTGNTQSTSSIASGGYQNAYGGGNADAFLAKFSASGIRLWGTYYGGSDYDIGQSCATDPSGNIYLGGTTESLTGISSGGYQNTYGGGTDDAFLVKFNAAGIRQWGTYYGGMNTENERSCTTDALGNVYLTGLTLSTSGIALGGFQNTIGGYIDAFLVKFNSSGIRQWGTYYGGSNYDAGSFCTTDAAGNIYLTGATQSITNIALVGFQNTYGGGYDAFLVKFNSSGIRQWGSYYGGTADDTGLSCAVTSSGIIYMGGGTNSTSNITLGGHQNTYGGGDLDAFLVKFNECANYSFTINQSICEGSSFAGYITTGTYVDTFTSAQGCDSIRTINLIVKPKSHTELDTILCYNTIVNWNGNTITSAGDYYYMGTNTLNCDSIVHLSVAYTPMPIIIDSILTGCDEVIYSGDTYTNNTELIDTFKNSNGCDSLYRNVTINVSKMTHDTLHIDLCQGESYDFNGRNFTTTTLATDAFTNSNGCDSLITLDLKVHTSPNVTLEYEPHLRDVLCEGDTIALIGAGAKDYIYYDNLNDTLHDRTQPVVKVNTKENKYFVIGIDENGCSAKSDVTIHTEPCCEMMIPNAFSPNGDGLNEDFGIETLGHPYDFTLQIFNRWGQRVFISHSPEEKWDGTYKGEKMEMDVYYYIITSNCNNGRLFKRKGDVNLIR